eukprot:SAG22_NODE_16823_length_317_cov_0.633028_1_plen_51_part_10
MQEYQEKALRGYQWIVKYIDERWAKAGLEIFQDELMIAKQMAELLPEKMDK